MGPKMKNRQSFYWWWKLSGKHIHRDIYRGIRNLIRYFSVIWCDNSWGSYSTFKLLKTKLKYIAKDVTKADYYVGWERDVERINMAIRLIDKVNEEEYSMEYMNFEEGEWSLEEYKEYKDKQDYSRLFKKYPRIYKYITNNPNSKNVFYYKVDLDDMHTLARAICQFNQDRASKLLFKLIEENIYSWGW